MPEPTLSDIHVDSALTDFSLAYFQREGTYIAPSIFPTVNVAQRSNKYFTYTKNDLLRTDATKRAPNTESAVRTYKISTDSYHCERYSIAVDVSEEETSNADAALDPEGDAARVTTQDLMIRMEKEWSAAAFTTGIWGTESTATWNTSTGDVIGDIQTGIVTVLKETGYRVNTLVLGNEAWYSGLWSSTQLLGRMSDASDRIVTPGFLEKLFGFDNVFILGGAEFVGDEQSSVGDATTGAVAFLHEDHALLAYVDPGAGLREATAGKTFIWSGLTGGGGGIRTKRLEMPTKSATRVETDTAFDFKVVATDLGYLIKHTVS